MLYEIAKHSCKHACVRPQPPPNACARANTDAHKHTHAVLHASTQGTQFLYSGRLVRHRKREGRYLRDSGSSEGACIRTSVAKFPLVRPSRNMKAIGKTSALRCTSLSAPAAFVTCIYGLGHPERGSVLASRGRSSPQ